MRVELTGIELITRERIQQVEDETFDAEHDDGHDHKCDELARAAAHYACPGNAYINGINLDKLVEPMWPDTWSDEWNKKDKHDRIKQLTIAGALLAAEIDRLKRKGVGVSCYLCNNDGTYKCKACLRRICAEHCHTFDTAITECDACSREKEEL